MLLCGKENIFTRKPFQTSCPQECVSPAQQELIDPIGGPMNLMLSASYVLKTTIVPKVLFTPFLVQQEKFQL